MRVISLYVHIPFCVRRCSYCSFFHVQTIDEFEGVFMDALEAEFVTSMSELGDDVRFGTVFIGGGTPSVLQPASLDRLFGMIDRFTGIEDIAEITVEVNPEDVTGELVGNLLRGGVNRLSVGMQSMQAIPQKVLRRCSPEVNRAAAAIVQEACNNVSFDVLVGIPGSSLAELELTTKELGELRPQHFSVYCLEAGGDMEAEVARFLGAIDLDQSADQYAHVCRHLAALGYHHYEVSNFALPGFESRHNRAYWDGNEYLGLGPGAHSYVDGNRFHNAPSLEDYLGRKGGQRLAARIFDRMAPDEAALESAMLQLRTDEGMAIASIGARGEVDRLCAQGLATVADGRLRLTDNGYLMCDEIILRLVTREGSFHGDSR